MKNVKRYAPVYKGKKFLRRSYKPVAKCYNCRSKSVAAKGRWKSRK